MLKTEENKENFNEQTLKKDFQKAVLRILQSEECISEKLFEKVMSKIGV